jgi:hypothetical protein
MQSHESGNERCAQKTVKLTYLEAKHDSAKRPEALSLLTMFWTPPTA